MDCFVAALLAMTKLILPVIATPDLIRGKQSMEPTTAFQTASQSWRAVCAVLQSGRCARHNWCPPPV